MLARRKLKYTNSLIERLAWKFAIGFLLGIFSPFLLIIILRWLRGPLKKTTKRSPDEYLNDFKSRMKASKRPTKHEDNVLYLFDVQKGKFRKEL
ncbi:MAG: hypothetical protein DRQ88_06110 [Epsilonproteobacteria bacterium]|nr:MAG: hypothetical protein DRQ88_06110 [Campylobacterota bacterium]